jgi:hypothetical protein
MYTGFSRSESRLFAVLAGEVELSRARRKLGAVVMRGWAGHAGKSGGLLRALRPMRAEELAAGRAVREGELQALGQGAVSLVS